MSNDVLARLDPRSILARAGAYTAFQRLVDGGGTRRFVDEVLEPKPGERVLDIGCGPADLLEYLPEVDYVGFDLSAGYIAQARQRFGGRGTFYCQRVSEATIQESGTFDLVVASGVVHHLDDAEARQLFRLAAAALKPAGRLVTLDGCYEPGQSWLARKLLDWDRGRYVRTQKQYEPLAREAFAEVTVSLRHDLLRLPYTHVILRCGKSRAAAAA